MRHAGKCVGNPKAKNGVRLEPRSECIGCGQSLHYAHGQTPPDRTHHLCAQCGGSDPVTLAGEYFGDIC